MMENMAAAKPQKSFLELPCRANRETKTTAENTAITKAKRPRILAFSFLGANKMKIKTYMVSITAPAPLMIVTSMLCGDTNGKPYLRINCKIRTCTCTTTIDQSNEPFCPLKSKLNLYI